MGLLFHKYITGKMPGFDKAEYDYAFESVLDGQKLELAPDLSEELREMINGMLECDHQKRLSMEEVYSIFQRMESREEGKTEEKPKKEEKPEKEESPISSDKNENADESLMLQWFSDAGDF